MINIDEAIRGEEAVADACKSQSNMRDLDDPYARNVAYENGKCAERHKQIAEWLKELKRLRERDANAILDSIKVEIESEYGNYDICEFDEDYDYEENNISEYTFVGSVAEILEIIDKYKVEMRVESLPTVRPTQIKGKWLNKGINGHNFYGKCSECGQEFCVDAWYTQHMKYCPNCSCQMKGENE
jgi:hypothetical protein